MELIRIFFQFCGNIKVRLVEDKDGGNFDPGAAILKNRVYNFCFGNEIVLKLDYNRDDNGVKSNSAF